MVQGDDFFGKGLADTFDVVEGVVLYDGFQGLGEGFKGSSCIAVGVDFKGIFAFEFEEGGDELEMFDDLIFVHGG